MTTLWKLTGPAPDWATGDTHWGDGDTHTAWIYAYTDPLLAVLLDPIHADIGPDAVLWEAEGEVGRTDRGLRVGCTTLTTIRQVPLPVVTTAQRVTFGILCAREVCDDPAWRAWADAWLDGTDRSERAAWAA